MFHSMKGKISITGLLLLMFLQSCPGIAMGYDIWSGFWGGLRKLASSNVKVSDEIIKKNKLKITNSLKAGSGLLEQKKLKDVSTSEKLWGQNGQNKLFQMQKTASLFMIGLEAGILNGLGNLGIEFYSLGAKIPTAPERLINFGFNYRENPRKYHQMVTNGALTVAGVLANPLPLLKQGKNTYLGAAKDPLKFGHLNGQGAAFVGTFFIGGTGVAKTVSSAEKTGKVAQVGSAVNKAGLATQVATTVNSVGKFTIADKLSGLIGSLKSSPRISSPLVPLQRGFKSFLANQRAVMSFASEGPSTAKIELFVSGLGGKQVDLGTIENGVVKLNKGLDFSPKQLKKLTSTEIFFKESEYNLIRLGSKELNSRILTLLKNKTISVEDGIKCNEILDQALLKTDDALGILRNEIKLIQEVRIGQGQNFKKIYNEGQLARLEGDVLKQINTLKESEIVSKGLLIEHKKLLGKVRIAKKELSQLNKGIGADDITTATLDKLMSKEIKWNLPKDYSPDKLYKLAGQIKLLAKADKVSKIQPKVSIEELAPFIKNNKRLPMNEGVVRTIADMAGADLTGVKIKIINKIKIDQAGDEIWATTSKFSNKITFYKGAFKNPLKLACVIGHERTHIFQLGLYRWELFKTGLHALYSDTGLEKFKTLINKFEHAAYNTHPQWELFFRDTWETYNKGKLL